MPGRLVRYTTLVLLLSLMLGALAACSSNDGDDDPSDRQGGDNEDATRDGGDEATRDEDDEETPDDDGDDSGDDEDDGDDGDIVSSGDGGCRVRVTGDIETEWEGADESVLTDYWLSEEEKRQFLEIFGGIGSDLDDDEIEATVEATLDSGEPVLGLLLMNCTGPGSDAITFFAPGDATEETFPFGPGDYAIGQGGILGGSDDGTVSILFSLGEDALFGVQDEGELRIERWDTSRIEGTFSFTAEESFVFEGEPRVVQVEGEFDFTCQDSAVCD